MAETPKTASQIDGAEPQAQPDNVVTDNSGQVPVQPVGTSDPTIDDNTNPKVPFDGADPRNIPPHDSNEQLHISAEKRMGAEGENLTTSAAKRREAVEAAYDNSRDVRDVIGDDDGDSGETRPAPSGGGDKGARATPPSKRSSTNPSQVKA